MAEFVQFRCEEMMPELEQMEKLKLFDKPEIRTIVKNRKDYEYKIQKRTKNKEDYLRYIQYEMDLLKLIRLKREKMGLHSKKNDFELVVTHRIIKLFTRVLLSFKEDVKMWLSYIKFCKQEHMYTRVSGMLEKMLQAHSDKPHMYKLAANWEFEEGGNVEKARRLLQKGIRMHPDSEMLYIEAFRLELMNAAALRRQKRFDGSMAAEEGNSTQSSPTSQSSPSKSILSLQQQQQQQQADHEHPTADDETEDTQGATQNDGGEDEGPDQEQKDQEEEMDEEPEPPQLIQANQDNVANGRLAEVIYDSAIKNLKSASFISKLLSISASFDFTHKLQECIVNDLLNFFPKDELTWDTMARRELEGLTYASLGSGNASGNGPSSTPANQNTPATSTGGKPHVPSKAQIRLCCDVFDAAVKLINTERMWTLYLEALTELNQDTEHLPKYKQNLLLKALQEAHNANCLQERFYIQWLEILRQTDRDRKLVHVLKSATEKLASVELFSRRLRYYLAQGDEEQGQVVFQQAVGKLGDTHEALRIWKIMLQFYQLNSQKKMEQVYQRGILRGPEVSNTLKTMYLEWIVLSKGIAAARKAYDVVSMQPPFSLELHTKMVELETLQPEQNVKQIRKCHELSCTQFGRVSVDVWIDYVKFEMEKGNAVNMSNIYFRATKGLNPIQSDIFLREYSLLKNNMSG